MSGWPKPYICPVYDRMCNYLAKIESIHHRYVYIFGSGQPCVRAFSAPHHTVHAGTDQDIGRSQKQGDRQARQDNQGQGEAGGEEGRGEEGARRYMKGPAMPSAEMLAAAAEAALHSPAPGSEEQVCVFVCVSC